MISSDGADDVPTNSHLTDMHSGNSLPPDMSIRTLCFAQIRIVQTQAPFQYSFVPPHTDPFAPSRIHPLKSHNASRKYLSSNHASLAFRCKAYFLLHLPALKASHLPDMHDACQVLPLILPTLLSIHPHRVA